MIRGQLKQFYDLNAQPGFDPDSVHPRNRPLEELRPLADVLAEQMDTPETTPERREAIQGEIDDIRERAREIETARETLVRNLGMDEDGEALRRAGAIGDGAAAVRADIAAQRDQAEKDRKQRTDTQIMLATMQEAQEFAAARAAEVAQMEAGFEERFGDAWREEIANRVMDPDDIPQRQPGESMEDYRERLEETLIETMIDPETDQIRPEYVDHPEHGEFAEWAHRQHLEQLGRDAANDPDAVDRYVRARNSFNAVQQVDQALVEENSAENEAVVEATNESHVEREHSASVEAASPFGQGP